MNINIGDVIGSLVPNAPPFYSENDKITGWDVGEEKTGIPQPSDADIQAETIRLQTEYDSQEYARLRQADYPSIQDCLHAILDDDLEALQVKRQEVKNRYPKP